MRSIYRALIPPLAALARPRRKVSAAAGLSIRGLGPLETKLLEVLWAQASPLAVRHVQLACPELAYTTVMTTLDRMYRKGVLLRHKDGRAFVYRPRCTRHELLGELVSGHVADLLGASEESSLILSTLVRAVSRADAALLDELEALVRAERLRLGAKD
jgi:predicted transcriptional regulator